MPTPEEGGHVQFSQKLVLTNADEYDKLMQNSGLADWSVTVKVGGDNGNTYQFSDGNTTPKRISERLGSSQRMTAEATSSDQRWMRSSQYDETVYMPVSWVVVPNDSTWGNSNSGLAEGQTCCQKCRNYRRYHRRPDRNGYAELYRQRQRHTANLPRHAHGPLPGR